jgi:hypothetical protein
MKAHDRAAQLPWWPRDPSRNTWAVPVLPAIRTPSSGSFEPTAVPRSFTTADMASRTNAMRRIHVQVGGGLR